MTPELTQAIQSCITTIVIAIIGLAGTAAVAYLNVLKQKALTAIQGMEDSKLKQSLDDAVSKAADLVESVVTSLEQEEKQEILEAMADGKVTKDELYKLKDKAVSKVTSQLGAGSVKILEEAFGNITEYIGDLVSKQVYTLKNSKNEGIVEIPAELIEDITPAYDTTI